MSCLAQCVQGTVQCGVFAATADVPAQSHESRKEASNMPQTQKAKAETFASSRTAILPCGCLGHMVNRDDEFVQFAIEQPGCVQHIVAEVIEVSRTEMLSSTDPSDGRASSTCKAPDLGSSPDTT